MALLLASIWHAAAVCYKKPKDEKCHTYQIMSCRFHTTFKLYDILMLSVCPIPFVCIASNSNGTWYCHLAVGITSKLQLLYTQFSWSEMDTWGTVDV